jgi:hypothetical protein
MVSLGAVLLALGCAKRPTGDGAPEAARDGVGIRPSASGNAAELLSAKPSASAVTAPVPSAAPSEAKTWAPQPPVAPVVGASGLAGYSDVTLPALGAELSVPDALAAKRAPNRLSTEDGSASIDFTELSPSKSLGELYAEATRTEPGSGRSITYKKQKDDWFVVSGLSGASIYYEKTTRLEGRILRFSFTFPAAQKKEYDEDTAYMANSFRALGTPGPELPKGRCYTDSECPKGYHCPPNGFCTINWGDD